MSTPTSRDISFFINGQQHKVPGNLPATTSLNEYIRQVAGLKGTKVMCQEAGCGCCAVTVTLAPPDSDKLQTFSVQSCITPLYAVDGWQITTVEGIGSQKKGFHPIQDGIAKFNGTQCGYCTPGMVMNMYGLLHQKPNVTAQDVEDNFDGNICRCTGYRPILDAMKSFTQDGNIPGAKNIDIEDLNKHLCPKTGEQCTSDKGGCRGLVLELDGSKWCRPTSLDDLSSLLKTYKEKKLRLFFGNTASAIYKNEGPFDVWIDLHRVKQLFSYEVKSNCVRFGACTSLTSFISKLEENQNKTGFKYFSAIIRHLKMVANVMVRNAGCIAGNLMIKHAHPEFPSDLFTVCAAAGGKVEFYDPETSKFTSKTFQEFLKEEMKIKVITAVELPKEDDNTVFKSFKITPRWQNAHAYVNAAFRFPCKGRLVSEKPNIFFGGINGSMCHAEKTEALLQGKTLTDMVVKEALKTLKAELNPDSDPLSASPKYRQDLAVSLLYKVLLGIYKHEKASLRSGADNLQRPISSGFQTFQEKRDEFPIKKAMPKITAPLQASGEALFVNDMPNFQHELFGAFVHGDQGNADIQSLDPSEALEMPGVLRFISAEDIPEGGVNNFMPAFNLVKSEAQELFGTKEIQFAGQAVGLVLADTEARAFAAAKKVKINYAEIRKPILTIEESIAAGKEFDIPFKEFVAGKPDGAWKTVDHTITGEVRMGTQYHFFLEPHVSLALPTEDGIDLYVPAQYVDMTQHAAALIIGKPMNYVNCIVPRVGGAFGGKVHDSAHCAAAATLAAYLTNRPVRVLMNLSDIMTICGKRPPMLAKYKVGFSNSGNVEVIEMDYFLEIGFTKTGTSEAGFHSLFMDMGYHIPNWKVRPHPMMSNKQSISPVRAPGSVPAATVIETIMEHVAHEMGKHPIMVKELNLYESGQSDHHGHVLTYCSLRELWRRLKDTAEVEGRIRQVEAFNKENMYKKRGLTMTSSKYGIVYFGGGYTANVSIYARDGTVVVNQGGVEMGQGLYTKVTQGIAYTLGIPLDMIKVRSNQTIISTNATSSGGSIASECSMMSAIGASEILVERMRPIREKFPDADWKDLCRKCSDNKIELSAKHTFIGPKGSPICNYFTYSVAAIETEVDILTGESQIRRVDIMADYGESLNPTIDIGQTEGAFVMGLGVFLSEDIVFDSASGRILNDGTWEYKPPSSKDIPIDWRLYLLPDSPNPTGVRSSRAISEPPISLAVGALLANKQAVEAARSDLFNLKQFIPTNAPYTVEKMQQSVGLDVENLGL